MDSSTANRGWIREWLKKRKAASESDFQADNRETRRSQGRIMRWSAPRTRHLSNGKTTQEYWVWRCTQRDPRVKRQENRRRNRVARASRKVNR